MAHRLFETEDQAKFYVQARPKPPTHLIEHIIDFVKQNVEAEGNRLHSAVDMGCGSGQCTFLLAPYFENVLGIDISPAQIREAEKERLKSGLENVALKVSPAESIPVADKSVQLITICTAAHFMNLEKVFDEGRRVLVPGGVMAVFAAGLAEYHYKCDESKDELFQQLYQEVFTRCRKYLVKEASASDKKQYSNIKIPYNDLTRGYDYLTKREVSFNTILNYVQSWSFYHTLAEVEGRAVAGEIISTFKKRKEEIIPLSEDEPMFTEQFSYYFVMARYKGHKLLN